MFRIGNEVFSLVRGRTGEEEAGAKGPGRSRSRTRRSDVMTRARDILGGSRSCDQAPRTLFFPTARRLLRVSSRCEFNRTPLSRLLAFSFVPFARFPREIVSRICPGQRRNLSISLACLARRGTAATPSAPRPPPRVIHNPSNTIC